MKTMQNRHILIADDEKLILDLFRDSNKERKLASKLSLSSTCEEALKIIMQTSPDIVLLDIRFLKSNMQGFECLKAIKRINKNIKVIMLTGYNNSYMLRQAYKHKADGFAVKGISMEDLIKAIDVVERGFFYRYDGASVDDISLTYGKYGIPEKKEITKCELDVLELISEGYNTKEIATKLFNSTYTIDSHRKSIRKKLDAKNGFHAVTIALNLGLIGKGNRTN